MISWLARITGGRASHPRQGEGRLPAGRVLLAVLLLGLLLPSLAPAGSRKVLAAPLPGGDASFQADGVLVAFKSRAPLAARLNAVHRLNMDVDPAVSHPYFARVKLKPGAARADFKRALAALKQDPTVRVAEPDYRVSASFVPNDPSFGQLWGLHNTGQSGGTPDADIDAPEAWDITRGSTSVVVAVIDTGVDYNHPDLAANILRDGGGAVVGYDYANNDPDPMDDNDHGTHCAGTIGGVGNNGVGVAGVCHTVKIMPMKFLTASGDGDTSAAISCIDYARTHGAKVMSNSWGGGGRSQLLLEAIQRARDAGILFVAAAGNESTNNDDFPSYPASYNAESDNVISVAATDRNEQLADFSNYGATTVDIAAPGVNILSTTPNNTYSTFSGTSMATPHVSGAAALVLARFPGLTASQLKARLLYSTETPFPIQGKVVTGRLNVFRALDNDTTPPGNPAGLAAGLAAVSGIQLSWTAPGDDGSAGTASTYELRYSTAPITAANWASATRAGSLPAPGLSGTPESYLLADLAPDSAYYVALRALDNVGNASALVTGGPFRTLAATTLFNDDVESVPSFAGTGSWNVTTEDRFSPTHSYTDSPGVPYGNNLNTSLAQTTAVTLTGQGPVLAFQARTDLEADFDFVYAEVTRDGFTWTAVAALTGTSGWKSYAVPLPMFRGASIRVRFRLVTDSSVTGGGVWLDDIRLYTNTTSYASPLEDTVEGSPGFAGTSPWAVSTEQSWSPTRAYSDSPGGSYSNNLDRSLTQSSPVSLAGFVPVLTFMARTDLERSYDFLYPEISTDDGANWRRLGLALTGTTEWRAYRVSLQQYAGRNVLVRFRLVTDFSNTAGGVWLDDIRIGGDQLRAAGNDAAFVSQSVPGAVNPGGVYAVSVTLRNTGGTTWTPGGNYRLGAQNPQDGLTWGLRRVALPASVAPGQEVTFAFNVTAPAVAGTYHFQWRMVQDGVEWFGPLTPDVPLALQGNAATFVSQSVPTAMTPGQSYPVSVTLTNTGATTWTAGGSYRLGAQNPQDNLTWGLQRVALPGPVGPGQQVTFTFNVTAPAAGTHHFQWRMVQDGVQWFGDLTQDVTVQVGTNSAAFVSQSAPGHMTPGSVVPVSVTLRNTGTTTWSTGSSYRLGAQSPQDGLTWGLRRVALPSSVPPGQQVTFTFNVTAPAAAGTYHFQWRMVQDSVEWFGDLTPDFLVDVSP